MKEIQIKFPKFILFLINLFSKDKYSFLTYYVKIGSFNSKNRGEDIAVMGQARNNIQEARKQELIIVEAMLKFSACFSKINIHNQNYFIGFTPEGEFILYTKKIVKGEIESNEKIIPIN